MTTTDPFTTAARAEGHRRAARAHLGGNSATTDAQRAAYAWESRLFEQAAEWARAYLAAREPDEAEVQAAAEAIADAAEGIEEWDSLTPSEQRAYRCEARAALSAARRARGEDTTR